jgi:hypothetical protein
VDFDFAEAVAAKIGKTGQFTLAIHFQGIKKRVPGRVAVTVAKTGEKPGVSFDPSVDPIIRELRACAAGARLEVIGDAEKQFDRAPCR